MPERSDRYEPLPNVSALPGWLWRKLGRRGRWALAGVLAVAAVVAVVAIPRMDEGKREGAARDRAELAAAVAAERARLRADQRPRTVALAGSDAAGEGTAALEAAITRDFRARRASGTVPPPAVRRTSCGRSPEQDPSLVRRGVLRLSCTAITSDVTGAGRAGAIGFDVVAVLDAPGRHGTWCKTNPPPGEKANGAALAEVPLSPACFGR